MPTLDQHHSNSLVKLLLIGDPKTGKTGSLISLVKAGYKLRILDLDNLLDILKGLVHNECSSLATNVDYRSLRDQRRTTESGSVIAGKPKAFVDALKMIDRWKYDDTDLGVPSEWGPDTILVIDSLSRLCDAAYDWRETLTPRGSDGKYDGRAVYGDAQDAIEQCLATLTSPSFATNVIVIAHVQYMDLPDGTKKGFPQGVGQKLSPKIPQYFPSVVHYTNRHNKRTMRTVSSSLIDLANPKPWAMSDEYPAETGLASFFEVLKGKPTQEAPAQASPTNPTVTTLRRKP
jgi:AAA domain